jgi:hypothetical protein
MISPCPICMTEYENSSKYSNVVCNTCLFMWGTLDIHGEDSVTVFTNNGDIFSDINGRIFPTGECTIKNIRCCAVINNDNDIIYVKTLKIPKKKTLSFKPKLIKLDEDHKY